MDRRFLIFLVLSFLVLMANTLWNAKQAAEQRAKLQAAGQNAAADPLQAGDAEPPDGEAATDAVAEDEANVADGDEGAGAEAAAEPAAPAEFVTLGSVDPESEFRMGVTITNVGAAVRRVELSSLRYLDLHDRGGYIGQLELAKDGSDGLLVNAVVPGTPAAEAGIEVGDRIVGAGTREAAPLSTTDDLAQVLAKARPNRDLKLAIVNRDGGRQTLTVPLRRRPLDVIRPESENILLRGEKLPEGFVEPPSYLMTLENIDDDALKATDKELAGVDLTTAAWRIVARTPDSATFERRLPDKGLKVTKHFKLARLSDPAKATADELAYHLTLEVTIAHEGQGAEAAGRSIAYQLDGPNGLPVEGWWYATKVGRTWSAAGIRDVIGRYFDADPQQLGAPAIAAGDAAPFESGSMAYMGVDAQYFASAIIPQKETPQDAWIASARASLVGPAPDLRKGLGRYANVTCRLTSEPVTLQPGESLKHAYTVFAGPKRPALLAKYVAANNPAYSLSDFVYYGWFAGVARLMLGILHVFYGLVGNYGIAIIMLTVLVRGLMFPISRGQAKSMMKLQELRPEMERIKERFKGDQQKQAQAMQQLYRKHNVNPLAGCLPMLIQLPVFVGLWRGLSVDVELRQAPLFGDSIPWVSNLSAPDMFWNWSAIMPGFITRGEGFFGLGPYLNLLPLVTVGLFLWQQKMFMPEPANEQAAMQQKIMKYMMVLMGIMFYKVPSGLCLYSIASSLWGIGERKLFPPPTLVMADGVAAGSATGAGKTTTSPVDERRAGKNGQAGAGRGGKKTKRRR